MCWALRATLTVSRNADFTLPIILIFTRKKELVGNFFSVLLYSCTNKKELFEHSFIVIRAVYLCTVLFSDDNLDLIRGQYLLGNKGEEH